MSAASGGNSEPKQGQRSQSARGFCPRSTMRVPQPDIIEHFGNADAVPQLPERCLSRKAGIVRCCLNIAPHKRHNFAAPLRGGIFYLFCMVQGKPCCLAPAGHAGFALCLRRIQRLICLGFSGSIGQVARAANSSWPVPGLYCGTRPCSAMLNQSVGVKIT